MISWLLARLPAWLTGRVGPRAAREVKSWTKNNVTLRTLRYRWFRRHLMWSTDHPVVFVCLVGAFATGMAYLVASYEWTFPWRLPALGVDPKFDAASYAGVPWSVQATLVALVYPIVLSFIALMLQRRAHSTAALRVYVLDSAVVPAGASSIGLLLWMGLQYFGAPYSSPSFLSQYIAPLLVLNGTWFAINLFLTGFFLSRTIRFIQEEEQRHAYTRVAVDIALRKELTFAVKQHIFVNSPQSDWGFPAEQLNPGEEPLVRMFSWREGPPAVKRDIRGSLVLHDVHLHLLKWVARRWCGRAKLKVSEGNRDAPTISFPPKFGEVASGEVVLCSIENGPPLTAIERAVIRVAFWYRPSRQGTMSLSTKKMLDEIGGEVEAAAEQHRFGIAEDGLRNVIRLHKTLLLASATESEAISDNAATIGTSPYAWGESSFAIEWLKPYRDIGRIAVNSLDEDSRLFRTLAVVPASIAAELAPKPEKLIIDAQLVGLNLAYQLAGWWTRKADASLAPGTTSFSGTLPAPLSKIYEQALVAFIGSWGEVHVSIRDTKGTNDAKVWGVLTARAQVYAKHLENSAQLFLKAVSRGDEAASTWLLDNFLKWWGNRQFELECQDTDDYIFRHATLTLAEKSWPEVQSFLWDGETLITINLGKKALNLALKRYWESIRLYLAILLINNAGPNPSTDSRELRLAAALINGTSQHHGGTIDCWPLDSIDAVSTYILGAAFGIESTLSRIDGFSEKLRWESEAPEVSGWIYGWTGTPTNLESMKRAQATLLVALATSSRQQIGDSKKLVETLWKDLDKLELVARYCQDLRREVLSSSFSSSTAAVKVLQTNLERSGQIRSTRLIAAQTMKRLRQVALYERLLTLRMLSVDEKKIRSVALQIAQRAFDAEHPLAPPLKELRFVPGLNAPLLSVRIETDKKHYVAGDSKLSNSALSEYLAPTVWQHSLAWSFKDRLQGTSFKPVNSPSLRGNYQATSLEMQTFASDVDAQCAALRATGIDPIVLVGNAAVSTYLRAHKWGDNSWQCPMPPGIVIKQPDPQSEQRAMALINDVPVYSFETPNGDCYVVPAAMLQTLQICGADAASSMNIEWKQLSDEKLQFFISWKSTFAEIQG